MNNLCVEFVSIFKKLNFAVPFEGYWLFHLVYRIIMYILGGVYFVIKQQTGKLIAYECINVSIKLLQ